MAYGRDLSLILKNKELVSKVLRHITIEKDFVSMIKIASQFLKYCSVLHTCNNTFSCVSCYLADRHFELRLGRTEYLAARRTRSSFWQALTNCVNEMLNWSTALICAVCQPVRVWAVGYGK